MDLIIPFSFVFILFSSEASKKKSLLKRKLWKTALEPKDAQRVLFKANVMHIHMEWATWCTYARQ